MMTDAFSIFTYDHGPRLFFSCIGGSLGLLGTYVAALFYYLG